MRRGREYCSKEWIMMRMSRRNGVVSVVLLSMSLAMAGCLNTGNEPPLGHGQNGQQPSLQRTTNYPNQPNNVQPVQYVKGPDGVIRQATFAQPQPGQPEEVIVEGALGQPTAMPGGPVSPPMPTELNPTTFSPHRVAAPDILLIEALRLVPKGPYKLEPMEVLQIEVTDTLPKQDIKGLYMVSPEGKINLGHSYGSVIVGGLTVDQVQLAIRNHLNPIIKGASVNVALVQMRGMQNIKGEHLVRPDGTISLGMYGSVFVAGMTLGQVKSTIESYLSAYLVNPQITVDVFAYNSRKIYIIADGAGYGQQVIALPATGNETVLDAISRVQGLPPVASLKKIWVSRPSPAGAPCSTVLPVDWKAITQAGQTTTNYQLLPGDRIYISSDPLICAYNYIDKLLAPVERVMGVALLGTTLFQSFRGNGTNGVIVAR
jgi:polysaccharide export outer membrane protein